MFTICSYLHNYITPSKRDALQEWIKNTYGTDTENFSVTTSVVGNTGGSRWGDLNYIQLSVLVEEGENFCIRLSEFPGNCSWVVIHGIPIDYYPVSNNISMKLISILEDISKRLRYSDIFLSLNFQQNDILFRQLENSGYKLIHNNINKHSGNKVFLYKKELK